MAHKFAIGGKKRDEIESASQLQERLKGGGNKPRLGELEDILFDQILFLRSNKEKVSRSWIQATAKTMATSEIGYSDFAASDRWLSGFMERYGLSLRRTTNLTILTDDEVTNRAVKYMQYLNSKRNTIDLDNCVLMDESALYFEDPRRDTVEMMGARHVVLKSSGFASMRITVVLAVTASAKKTTPLLIWKGKNENISKVGGIYVAYQTKAWINSELLQKWVNLVFPSVLSHGAMKKTVVWDSMRAHISTAVKVTCKRKEIDMIVIPGGMTAYLQAGDIGIYKSFKDNMSPVIDAWKKSDRVQFTRNGNPKPPNVEEVVKWVQHAWKAVPDEVVWRSVLAAGFSENFEDWHIARHDVYGQKFREKWLSAQPDASDDDDLSDLVSFDELFIIDDD